MPNFIKAFDIPKTTEPNSNDGVASKDWKMSCVIESNWFIHESDERKSDLFGFKSCSF